MSLQRGHALEDKAAAWLCQQGCELLEQRVVSRFGELDLVVKQQDVLVVVEVKYRRANMAEALESVTMAKRIKLIKAAQWLYANRPEWQSLQWRFDVVAVSGPAERPEFKWLKAAFDLQA